MTVWLQKRLAVWMGISLLCGAVLWNSISRVQADLVDEDGNFVSRTGDRPVQEPHQKLTRDEVAKKFVSLLEILSRNDNNSFIGLAKDIISDKTDEELDFQTPSLLEEMASQWKQLHQTVKVQSEGDKTTTVTVEIDATPPVRPIVLIEEKGGWGVDLVETYAKWNNLEGVAKAEAIYKLTGVVLEGLPRTEEITRRSCQSNLKQIALGIAQYAQDYDEKFPPAKPWVDVLQPYMKSEQFFKCPSVTDAKGYGYAYNSKLSEKPFHILSSTPETVSLYETNILKRNAYGMGESPAFRHLNGANYAFADGHVKWFPQTQIPSFNLGRGVKSRKTKEIFDSPIIGAPPE